MRSITHKYDLPQEPDTHQQQTLGRLVLAVIASIAITCLVGIVCIGLSHAIVAGISSLVLVQQ